MLGHIFQGRRHAQQIEENLKMQVRELKARGIMPKLVVILIGDDPASHLYVTLKKQAAERCGVIFEALRYNEVTPKDLIQQIKVLNKDSSVHGIMVQLPLPGDLGKPRTKQKILGSIASKKDVDGETTQGVYMPATVKGILSVIDDAMAYTGKNKKDLVACVVGATGMVGTPLVDIIKKDFKQLIVCDKKTKKIASDILKADVLISATGVEKLIKPEMVKDGAIIIDVGAPKGDVEPLVIEKVAYLTPVPGGIGPMTVICLIENTVLAASKAKK